MTEIVISFVNLLTFNAMYVALAQKSVFEIELFERFYFATITTSLRFHIFLERVNGVEPSCPLWKSGALPLSYTRLKIN